MMTNSSPASSPTALPAETSSEQADFDIAYCDQCHKDVLLYGDLGAGDELIARCIECDGVLPPGIAASRVTAQAIVDMGYFVDGVEVDDGCGTGGCRDGKCGVAQPDDIDPTELRWQS